MKEFRYIANKDNIEDFYSYCKLRNDSPTYKTNYKGLKEIEILKTAIKTDRICCSKCGNSKSEVALITRSDSDEFSIYCPSCGKIYTKNNSEAVAATIKWYADEEENTLKKHLNKTNTNKENKINNKEEREVMKKNKGFNLGAMFAGLEFGMVQGDDFKLSMYGVAFKNRTGKWNATAHKDGMCSMEEEAIYVAYDKNKGELINVDAINFNSNGLIMKMPVAMSQVNVGDIIMHQNNPVVVKNVRTDGNLEVISPGVAEIKIIMPIKNMFGFNFYTKVMPLLDINMFGKDADESNPFGSLMPIMLMSSMMGEDNDIDPMTMMLMMNSMNGGSMDIQSMLPFMMLSGNNDMSDMMPLFMMQSLNKENEMDMNMMLPLMMMSKGDKEMNPLMMLMFMNGGMFNKKEEELNLEELKRQLSEEFHRNNNEDIQE